MQSVILLARMLHWETYHTHDSRRSDPGFPDLVLVRPPRLIFAELKSQKGRVTAEQLRWVTMLEGVPGVMVYIWRPSMLPIIESVLR